VVENCVANTVVQTLCCKHCGEEADRDHIQTLVPIAANGGKDLEVIDAAACTFLHEGRIVDFRCKREPFILRHWKPTFYMKGGEPTFAAPCIEVYYAGLSANLLHSRRWLLPENQAFNKWSFLEQCGM
jgi:hypothetical protein